MTKNREFIFATNNKHKLEEVSGMLGASFSISTPKDCGITEDIPENELTIEGNALSKARYIYNKLGKDCFADDTGLEVDALNGAPGVYSARYAGLQCNNEDNMTLLLKNLEGVEDRKARFKTVVALIINGEEFLFEGCVYGRILEERVGIKGFGYDPLFLPDGYDKTFAEMDMVQKNSISHRGRAMAKLINYLKESR